jgi:hypothetical protein
MGKRLIYGSAAICCVVAVLPLPYSFYILLRILVCFSGAIASMELKNEGNTFWLLLAGVAVLFIPILPIYLERGIWFFIDLAVAGVFVWMVSRNKSQTNA